MAGLRQSRQLGDTGARQSIVSTKVVRSAPDVTTRHLLNSCVDGNAGRVDAAVVGHIVGSDGMVPGVIRGRGGRPRVPPPTSDEPPPKPELDPGVVGRVVADDGRVDGVPVDGVFVVDRFGSAGPAAGLLVGPASAGEAAVVGPVDPSFWHPTRAAETAAVAAPHTTTTFRVRASSMTFSLSRVDGVGPAFGPAAALADAECNRFAAPAKRRRRCRQGRPGPAFAGAGTAGGTAGVCGQAAGGNNGPANSLQTTP